MFDLLFEAAWVVGNAPTWMGYGLGWTLITGALCAVSWLHGNDRIGGNQ